MPRQGHNTPLPLKRSSPASFKRLLGSPLAMSIADKTGVNVRTVEARSQQGEYPLDVSMKLGRESAIQRLEFPDQHGELELVEDRVAVRIDEVDAGTSTVGEGTRQVIRGVVNWVTERLCALSLKADVDTHSWFGLPNGSRLSCGRLARRRKAIGRRPCPARGTTLRFL